MKTDCEKCGEPLEVVEILSFDGSRRKHIICSKATDGCSYEPVPYSDELAAEVERARWPSATRVASVEAKLADSETGFGKATYVIVGRPGIYRRFSASAPETKAPVMAWLDGKGPLPFRRWVEAEKVFGLVAAPEEKDADDVPYWRQAAAPS